MLTSHGTHLACAAAARELCLLRLNLGVTPGPNSACLKRSPFLRGELANVVSELIGRVGAGAAAGAGTLGMGGCMYCAGPSLSVGSHREGCCLMGVDAAA